VWIGASADAEMRRIPHQHVSAAPLTSLGFASLRAGCAGLRGCLRLPRHGRGMPGGRVPGSKAASFSRCAWGKVQ
jgi:hypothetical protein